MARPLLQPLLLLLLSFALGSAGQEGLHPAQDTGERIINGVVCPKGSHPWQVALYDNNGFQCAGVLVHPQWVLTVAHCYQSEYIVQMGSDLPVDARAQRIMALQSFIHHRYNNRTDDHDIMLVRLCRPATLSPTVNTIDLPSSCKDPGTSCTVSGWGVTTPNGELGVLACRRLLPQTKGDLVPSPLYPGGVPQCQHLIPPLVDATRDGGAEKGVSELMCLNVNLISYQHCKPFYPTMLKKYMLCAAPLDRLSYCCTCPGA
ncbi:kallikrein-7-like [Myotis lucifugus]|uniref:kallikrein-7-like n=1 Tax=Myotis lucifugus TaxID=59463 RepID=UPI000CCC36F7|nr:kallikrein-7-like [Myotis lucifugus]